MNSIIYIIALSILVLFIYGFFLNYYDKFKNIKRMYIPINKSKNKSKNKLKNKSNNIELDSIELDNIESDNIESDNIELDSIELDSIELDSIDKYIMQNKNSNTCKNNDDCINGGICEDVINEEEITYKNCKCIQPFSGDNCQDNIGVRVMIKDNFTSPTLIERVPMYTKEGYDYFIQDNNYL